ncbi:hypothetical protein IQ270_19555 [Microcoleus sp. LEGE 07076]|nr:hypothetical protein [Microcoleus sp. LEGE 07076]
MSIKARSITVAVEESKKCDRTLLPQKSRSIRATASENRRSAIAPPPLQKLSQLSFTLHIVIIKKSYNFFSVPLAAPCGF